MSRSSDLESLGFPNCPTCPFLLNGKPSTCAACAGRTLHPLAPRHCSVCSQSWGDGQTTCRNTICRWPLGTRCFTRVDAIAVFAHPLEWAIKRFKYDGRFGWAHIFGRLIVGWLDAHEDDVADIDLILGNPSSPERTPLQHIEAIMRAAHAEDILERWPFAAPDSPVLIKTRETKKSAGGAVRWQEKMRAAREHAEALRIRHDVEGRRILLVDDVFTTGATFHTVGKRLIHEAGALEVRRLVLARAPYGTPAQAE